jgi:hypothetical protein
MHQQIYSLKRHLARAGQGEEVSQYNTNKAEEYDKKAYIMIVVQGR